MKAVILAAGKGVRMLPLTDDTPKALVEINGKPFLYYVIENLKKAGFTELGIIVGYKKEKIKEFLQEYNLKATLIEQKELLGTGDAVLHAKGFVDGDDFMVVGGDNLFSSDDLLQVQKDDEYCYVSGWEVENPQRYGVLVRKGNVLVKIVEKPKTFIGNIINAGLYKFTSDIFEALEEIEPSERGELELTDAISLLAEQGKVKVVMLKDYWIDLGTKEDVERVEELLKNL